MPSQKRTYQKAPRWLRWLEKVMAIIALVNLALVLFDLSYLPGRDYYLRADLFMKDFQVNKREKYLATVYELQDLLQAEGLHSPQVQELLQTLRVQSEQLVDEELFRVTGKYGALSEIKERMREYMEAQTAEEAFQRFWSEEYLEAVGWRQALDFFNSEVAFLFVFYEPRLFYDPVKGIEPYRGTQRYLRLVDELTVELQRDGLQSEEVDDLLGQLRELSETAIDDNFFERANKTGTLEEIKNKMRRHIYSRNPEDRPQGPDYLPRFIRKPAIEFIDFLAPEVFWADKSATQAFMVFWSRENLAEYGWEEELRFFNREIEFLMLTNYYRHYGVNSEYIDRFWIIDAFFAVVFLADLLFRSWLITRRHKNVSLEGAIFWRWYDLLLLVPFWRWLRIIPVVIRLNEADLIEIEWIRKQLRLGLVATFAEELTQVVVVQVINQLKGNVESGELSRALLEPSQQTYIDINDVNEVQAISNRVLKIAVCKVLPEVQPDLEALLHHQMENTLKNSGVYQRLQRLPGLGNLSHQMAEQLVNRVSKIVTEGPENAYHAITEAPPDPVGEKLTQQLVEHFGQAMRAEFQKEQTIEELESLVSDLLEEIKINYVQRAVEADPEDLFDETEELRKLAAQRSSKPAQPPRSPK